ARQVSPCFPTRRSSDLVGTWIHASVWWFHGNRILTYRIPGAPARAVKLAQDTLRGIQPGAVPGTLSGAVPPPPSSALNGRRLNGSPSPPCAPRRDTGGESTP